MAKIGKNDKMAMMVKGRSSVYGLLARLYSREPNQDVLKSLKDPGFLQLLNKLGIKLGEDFRKKIPEELVEELSIEYTRLFIGPGRHIYPYESAYRNEKDDTSLKMQKEIKNLIESHGLQYRPDFTEGFDHISVELEFMERLTQRAVEVEEKKDFKKASGFIELGRQFIDEHLIKWVPEFSDRVIKEASLSFYREIARLTKEFILLEGVGDGR